MYVATMGKEAQVNKWLKLILEDKEVLVSAKLVGTQVKLFVDAPEEVKIRIVNTPDKLKVGRYAESN